MQPKAFAKAVLTGTLASESKNRVETRSFLLAHVNLKLDKMKYCQVLIILLNLKHLNDIFFSYQSKFGAIHTYYNNKFISN